MRVAVIPARGGSKRIPRKNIKLFHGKPIIAYSIEAAQACGLFERIIVSTDDDEIAEVARRFGAEVPFMRPKELSDDYTGTTAVMAHAIRTLQEQGDTVDAACCIYATAPFLEAEFLRAAYAKLMDQTRAFTFSATSYSFPIFRAIHPAQDDSIAMFWPEHLTSRSQDLPEAYHDAGQFYWGSTDAWLSELPIFAPHSSILVLPRHLVQDIDTPEDWKRAELMFHVLKTAPINDISQTSDLLG
ncbi:MAG: pseudaminic acid cytidylyltransferase [Sulfuricurvum sp.]|nr:pseudaminic acid cytidylyltransferase [Sulfuricurvum sp.]